MRSACEILEEFGVPFEVRVVSAHRTPDRTHEYAVTAKSRGIQCIIAGAGGAAHLPGVIAASSTLPVLAVPVETKFMGGLDSLLSIVPMPGGVPVSNFSIGKAGAKNAALFAVRILALNNVALQSAYDLFVRRQADKVPKIPADKS
jgi:5-(carboxyamino)imidazole ribonucleotide mutase